MEGTTMSKLDELIQQYCPDGIEYKKLYEITIWNKKFKGVDKNKQPIIIPRKSMQSKDLEALNTGCGDICLLFAGVDIGWTDIEISDSFISSGEVIAIPEGKSTPLNKVMKYYNGKFIPSNNLIATTFDNNTLNLKYLFYVLQTMESEIETMYQGDSLKHPKMPEILELDIPVPPLPVQEEIVRILDKFTELEAELDAELDARRKQYEYYRDTLLSSWKYEIPTLRLADVCKTITTGKLNANAMDENGLYPFFTCDANPYRINTYAFDTKAILISGNGSQVGHINYYEGKFNAYQRTYVLSDFTSVDEKYLLHYLKAYLRNHIEKNSKKGSIPYITLPMLTEFKIPVPPLDVQQRLVNVLDNFDTICSDLSIGLPAEISARQKQYEYYRDLLFGYAANGLDFSRAQQSTAEHSRVDEIKLIQYVFGSVNMKIKDVFNRVKGTPITAGKMKEIENTDGAIKIFAGGKTVVNAHKKDIPNANIITVPSVLVQSRGVIDFVYYDKPFTFKNEMWAYTSDDQTTTKYLYYVLQNNVSKFRVLASDKGSMPQIALPMTEDFVISIPQIEEQRIVVNILDRFDKLCNDISEGLPAEIAARNRQYEWYRNKLLNFS